MIIERIFDKVLGVKRPTSKRWYSKGSNGSYLDDDAIVGSLNEYEGDTEVSIPSTAIEKYKYNKKTHMLDIWYRGGNKWYTFGPVPEHVKESFENASSKGRFANNILKPKYHAEGYV